MLSPKDKASELISKYKPLVSEDKDRKPLQLSNAQKHALEEIKEMINTADSITSYDYWNKVKKEIEIL
jgi:hypothetical protein